jgi:hypothetical protein
VVHCRFNLSGGKQLQTFREHSTELLLILDDKMFFDAPKLTRFLFPEFFAFQVLQKMITIFVDLKGRPAPILRKMRKDLTQTA